MARDITELETTSVRDMTPEEALRLLKAMRTWGGQRFGKWKLTQQIHRRTYNGYE